MRLFTAVVPPEAVRRELAGAVGRLAATADPGLRWTADEAHHVTLAFLGEVDDAALPELTRRLARAARRHAPFTLRLAGGGRFGDHVLWAGVTGDTAELGRLAGSVTAAARRSGVAVEDRPYRPHVTLARNRGPAALRPYAALLDDFRGAVWPADRLSLIRSHPPAPGRPGARSRYETLEEWPLGG